MRKLIVAHRGASKAARGNTLEAFQKAIDAGAEMVELDVRRSRDGVLIVIHDPDLAGYWTADTDYAALENLARRQGFHLPTLEEALRLGSGKIKFDLELKERRCEDEAVGLAAAILPADDFMITSFRAPVILRVKKQYPRVRAGLLREPAVSAVYQAINFADPTYLIDSFFGRRKAVEASDFVAFHKLLYAAGAADRGPYRRKPYYVYTVDDKALMGQLWRKPRLLGLITNVPDRAREVIKGI